VFGLGELFNVFVEVVLQACQHHNGVGEGVGERLASASEDRTLKVWDAFIGQETLTLKEHKGWVGSVAFSPGGRRLASGSQDGTVTVWDASLRQPLGQ
jgi:WD40 repeat protein